MTPLEPEPVRTGGGRRATDCLTWRRRVPLIEGTRRFVLTTRQEVGPLDSHRFHCPALVFVTPSETLEGHLVTLVTQAVQGGVTHVILRQPGRTARELYRLATRLAIPIHSAGGRLVIADRLDVALAIEGAGVQLSERSLPLPAVRSMASGRLVGVSVHDTVWASTLVGADWLIAGNIYDTATHPDRPGKGAGLVRDIASATDVPVVAIGGITAERIPDVVSAGAAGVAVIRAISDAPDPSDAARTLRRALDLATGEYS